MGYSLKPGVVTGEDYKTLLKAAKEGGYALPAVNAVGTNSVNAVMEAAAKNRSDVIVQFSNSGGQFFAGKSLEDVRSGHLELEATLSHLPGLATCRGLPLARDCRLPAFATCWDSCSSSLKTAIGNTKSDKGLKLDEVFLSFSVKSLSRAE